jgi:hypothetical protein
MIKVRVLTDDFCIGITQYKKGEIFQTLPPAANYMVANGSCEIVEDKPAAPAKKPSPKKKIPYKRRDMKAE